MAWASRGGEYISVLLWNIFRSLLEVESLLISIYVDFSGTFVLVGISYIYYYLYAKTKDNMNKESRIVLIIY